MGVLSSGEGLGIDVRGGGAFCSDGYRFASYIYKSYHLSCNSKSHHLTPLCQTRYAKKGNLMGVLSLGEGHVSSGIPEGSAGGASKRVPESVAFRVWGVGSGLVWVNGGFCKSWVLYQIRVHVQDRPWLDQHAVVRRDDHRINQHVG